MNNDSQHLANLLGMARSAELAGNNEEAVSYYNRVLEDDPTCSDAWFGKGRAAGLLSTVQKVRIGETVVAFGHAVATAAEDVRQAVAQRAAAELTRICSLVYQLTRQYYVENRTLDSAHERYAGVSIKLLDAIDGASAWATPDRATLDTTARIAREVLDMGVVEPVKSRLRAKLDATNTAIEAIDAGYRPQPLATQTDVEQQRAASNFNALGYIVLFVVILIAVIIGVALPHHHYHRHY